MSRKKINLLGVKFGRLTVLEDLGIITTEKGYRVRKFKCLCDCGNTCVVAYQSLVNGNTKSCGCLKRECSSNNAGRPKQYNDYYIHEYKGQDVVYVVASNKADCILVDVEDWDQLKDTCWHITKHGYAAGLHNGEFMTMQKALIPEVPDGHERDHVNRDRLDNRRCNLEVKTKLENLHNREYKYKTSQHTGVCWYSLTNQWLAYITDSGNFIRLGLFDNEDDAIAIRKQAEMDLWGKIA